MRDNTAQIIAAGSKTWPYSVPAINSGVVCPTIDVVSLNPDAQTFAPFDSLVVQNNSAQNIEVYLNGNPSDSYPVPAYMIQPIMRRWYRRLTIKNTGSGNTNAGDIVLQFRRLPPDIQPTVRVQ